MISRLTQGVEIDRRCHSYVDVRPPMFAGFSAHASLRAGFLDCSCGFHDRDYKRGFGRWRRVRVRSSPYCIFSIGTRATYESPGAKVVTSPAPSKFFVPPRGFLLTDLTEVTA